MIPTVWGQRAPSIQARAPCQDHKKNARTRRSTRPLWNLYSSDEEVYDSAPALGRFLGRVFGHWSLLPRQFENELEPCGLLSTSISHPGALGEDHAVHLARPFR